MSWIGSIDRRFYPGVEDNWDDALFRIEILNSLSAEFNVLDLGAGAGIVAQMNFRGHVQRVCGIDVDSRVKQNPYLDEAHIGDVSQLPFADEEFDVVIADNLLEHLPDPERTFAEVSRVLKRGGAFLVKTPQKFHYVPLIARVTPLRFHKAINRRRGRAELDTFPTLYKANSAAAIRKLAQSSGFQVEKLERIEGRPEYLRLCSPVYLMGVLYERFVNSCRSLEVLRVLLIVKLRKPGTRLGCGERISAE